VSVRPPVYMMKIRTNIVSAIIHCSRLQAGSWMRMLASCMILLLTLSHIAISDEDVEECEYMIDVIII